MTGRSRPRVLPPQAAAHEVRRRSRAHGPASGDAIYNTAQPDMGAGRRGDNCNRYADPAYEPDIGQFAVIGQGRHARLRNTRTSLERTGYQRCEQDIGWHGKFAVQEHTYYKWRGEPQY